MGKIKREKRYDLMSGSERPFSQEGLKCEEIEILYRDGADKRKMVGILAELCATDRRRMERFLRERGASLPENVSGSRRRGRTVGERYGEGFPEFLEKLTGLAADGKTVAEAAREVGKSRKYMDKIRMEYGIAFREDYSPSEKSRLRTERIESGRQLAQCGKTSREAAEILGVDANTVRKYAKEGGYAYAKAKSRDAG